MNMWFQTLMRQFFFNIDKIVFNFISIVYDLLISIARTSVLSQADIIDMADRIYKLLAIFMIFKVTFSLIMYVVNPDDFSDKTKGVSKLGTNIIIALALLILTPYAFNYAYQLQTIVLEDNSLATLIFGDNGEENKFLNTAGEDMAFITMRPFFMPDTSITAFAECTELSDACFDALSNATDDKKFTTTMVANYKAGISASNLGLTFRQNLAIATTEVDGDTTYVMDYRYLFSTIVGVIVVILLITFCMDVAVRSIKLAFLQLIAPIPIISYVDPKSGKDGLFKKWYQMCFKTYLSLFIRLLAIYFAVYIISRLNGMVDIVDGSQQTNAFIAIFIIIGALMFAKQLPKILEGLGIKLDGGFTLNPLKKIEKDAIGGKKLLGFSAAAGAAGLAGLTNFGSRVLSKDNWTNKNGKITAGSLAKGLVKAPGSAIAGATSALQRGSFKAAKGEKAGKIFSNSYGEAMFAKLQREDLKRKGSTFVGRRMADFNRITGNLNAAQRQTLDLAELDAEYKNKTDAFKNEREILKADKAKIAEAKNEKIKIHTQNRSNLASINDRISNLKGVKDSNGASINVKDRQELVDNLKASGNFYVKVGEEYTYSEKRIATAEDVIRLQKAGKQVEEGQEYIYEEKRIATATDVANMVKSDVGQEADSALSVEKDRALDYLKDNDKEVKERIKILEDNGVDVSSMSASDVKVSMVKEQNAENAVNAEYYTQEQEFSEREKDLDKRETETNEEYKRTIKELGLDKDSPQWAKNEADNAARRIKSPQQEGWKPSGTVNSSSYVPNPRLGGGPGGPGGPRGSGGSGGPGSAP